MGGEAEGGLARLASRVELDGAGGLGHATALATTIKEAPGGKISPEMDGEAVEPLVGETLAVDPARFEALVLPVDRHPVAVYLAGMAPGSRRAMAAALERAARLLSGGALGWESFPWPLMRYQHAQAVRSHFGERYAPATVNRMVAALRGVARECWRLGLVSAEDYRRTADIQGMRGERLPRGRALSQGEMLALFTRLAGQPGPAGVRDAALLGVLYASGLRRSEAVALWLQDFDPPSGALKVRRGKGNKDRVVYAADGALEALGDWLAVRGPEPGPLFCPVTKGGRVEIRPMSDQAVYLMLKRLGARAGVKAFSPHDLRRTMISDLLEAGADLAVVQGLAGHSDPGTTARYDRRGEKARRKAAALLHIPYRALALKGE